MPRMSNTDLSLQLLMPLDSQAPNAPAKRVHLRPFPLALALPAHAEKQRLLRG